MEPTRVPETRTDALRRLACRARERGVSILEYPPANEFYATSTSRPGELHRITLVSCDCLGFLRHARCGHHALLLVQLGQVPPDPESDPAGPAAAQRECARLERLAARGRLRTTSDWHALATARRRVGELAA